MYAVFQLGNKQYRVLEGQIIQIDRIDGCVGTQLEFDQVLFLKNNDHIRIGNPWIINVKIIAKIIAHNLSKKIEIIKFRRRKHFRKFQGHRQRYTTVKIISINII